MQNVLNHCVELQVGKSKARPALSLVGYEEELRPAMEFVFGSTFVCDSLDIAKKVSVVNCWLVLQCAPS